MLPDDVTAYLADHRDRHLQRYFEFLRIPSVANLVADPHPCDRAARWLADYLGKLGLAAAVHPTAGKPAVIATHTVDPAKPTVLIYGHYDVQPAEPLELWDSDPFEPTLRDEAVYARGANDDKGQFFTHLMALEALLATGRLGVNVKVFCEGEEEIGSPNMEPFLARHADLLAADVCLVSDSGFYDADTPAIIYGLRGLAYFEVTLHGPDHDLHSGLHGGATVNPVNALAAMVGAMHDADGRVRLEGFYDDVRELTEEERNQWQALDFDETAYAAELGVDTLAGGEAGFTALERIWARPTLDCNGIVGGYTAQGSKTIIPSRAHAKISCRLVADQDPQKITESIRAFVQAHTPPGCRAELKVNAEARPVLVPPHSQAMDAARAALAEAFGKEPAMIRCGASIPITEVIQRLLGLDPVLMGFGLPDDNLHAPNEHFALRQLFGGSVASAAFLHRMG